MILKSRIFDGESDWIEGDVELSREVTINREDYSSKKAQTD